MRTIKELLILLREKLPEYLPAKSLGLCSSMKWLRRDGLITLEEYDMISTYVYMHRPGYFNTMCGYWWHPRSVTPRLEFLDKLIDEIDEN